MRVVWSYKRKPTEDWTALSWFHSLSFSFSLGVFFGSFLSSGRFFWLFKSFAPSWLHCVIADSLAFLYIITDIHPHTILGEQKTSTHWSQGRSPWCTWFQADAVRSCNTSYDCRVPHISSTNGYLRTYLPRNDKWIRIHDHAQLVIVNYSYWGPQ